MSLHSKTREDENLHPLIDLIALWLSVQMVMGELFLLWRFKISLQHSRMPVISVKKTVMCFPRGMEIYLLINGQNIPDPVRSLREPSVNHDILSFRI